MIFDKIENLHQYISEENRTAVKDFLQQVREDMPEGVYEICGERIYAKVMSYVTKPAENCRIEAHNRYIDIQSTICGAEGIAVYPRESLVSCEKYNETADVEFFDQPEVMSIYVNNFPGYFTMLMPNEAHSPQQRVADIDHVKKFVIKVLA